MEVLVQFIKFGLVGVTNTCVSWVVYFIFNTFLFPGVWIIGSVVSWIVSVLWAYFLQNVFVFREDKTKQKRVWWQTLIKTYISYAFTGLFLNNLLLLFWTEGIDVSSHFGWLINMLKGMNLTAVADYLSVSSNLGWFLNMLVSIPLNFVINKFWAYRQKKK